MCVYVYIYIYIYMGVCVCGRGCVCLCVRALMCVFMCVCEAGGGWYWERPIILGHMRSYLIKSHSFSLFTSSMNSKIKPREHLQP